MTLWARCKLSRQHQNMNYNVNILYTLFNAEEEKKPLESCYDE